jgi:hypothetical protein
VVHVELIGREGVAATGYLNEFVVTFVDPKIGVSGRRIGICA